MERDSIEAVKKDLNEVKERIDNGQATGEDALLLWQNCWFLLGMINGMEMADRHDHSGRSLYGACPPRCPGAAALERPLYTRPPAHVLPGDCAPQPVRPSRTHKMDPTNPSYRRQK